MSVSRLYAGNDCFFLLENVAHGVTGRIIEGGTGIASLYNAATGVKLAGLNDFVIAQLAPRSKMYVAYIPKEASLVAGEDVEVRWSLTGPNGEDASGEETVPVVSR